MLKPGRVLILFYFFVSCQTLGEFFSLSGPQFIYDLAVLKTQQEKGLNSAWHVVHALKT